MIPWELRKWLAFGNGIGIEIAGPHGGESLRVTAVRVRPGRARVLGQLVVEDFPHQPAGVWGTEYAAFVRKFGVRHVSAAVLLPRQDLIVRQLALPGVSSRDLASAVQFQLDGLHPYSEDDVIADWAQLPGGSTVLVAIARRAVVERYAALFAEAGIKISSFGCSAAAIYSALRIFSAGPASGLLAFERASHPRGEESGAGRVEFYGESPAHPLFSASFDAEDESAEPRLAALARAELRLDAEIEARPLKDLLSAEPALPYAAALASACPRLALDLNLLPADQRQTSSRMQWIPSAALGVLVLLLAVTLAAFPGYEDRRYLRSLQAEIAKVEPGAARANALDRQIEIARRRTLLLDEFRRRGKDNMDALGELTRILPPPTWVNQLEIAPTQVIVGGETDQAAPLLRVIDSSPLFKGSEFISPPVRSQNGEQFRIRSNRGTAPR
jgi:hypothetical protein